MADGSIGHALFLVPETSAMMQFLDIGRIFLLLQTGPQYADEKVVVTKSFHIDRQQKL